MIIAKSGIEKLLRVLLAVFVVVNAMTPSMAQAKSFESDETSQVNSIKPFLFGLFPNKLLQTPSCGTEADLVIGNGVTCSLAAGEYTYNTITIQTGGTLVALGNTTLNQGVTINATNITIEAGGKISADGAGYPGSSQGPGAGGNPNPVWNGGGAGHGGIGQNGDGVGGGIYGSETQPLELGSSGGLGKYIIGHTVGGAGGGVIYLKVSNTIISTSRKCKTRLMLNDFSRAPQMFNRTAE